MQAASAPVAGDRFDLKEHLGALLYFHVNGVMKDLETSFGPADAVATNIAVLDGPHKGDTYDDALIFPKVLAGQLARVAGSVDPVIVGRLGQGLAKPGKSAPWLLQEPTADDLATATKYETYAKQQAAAQAEPF